MSVTIWPYSHAGRQMHAGLPRAIDAILKLAGCANPMSFEPIPEAIRHAMSNWNGSDDLVSVLLTPFIDTDPTGRIFVFTEPSSAFAIWCKSMCPHAEWSCSNGFFSVDYSPEETVLFNQLHELLHLLGADDCYNATNLKPVETCQTDACVMRYGDSTLSVCDSVLEQLRMKLGDEQSIGGVK